MRDSIRGTKCVAGKQHVQIYNLSKPHAVKNPPYGAGENSFAWGIMFLYAAAKLHDGCAQVYAIPDERENRRVGCRNRGINCTKRFQMPIHCASAVTENWQCICPMQYPMITHQNL